jgi:hypothetical protein
MRRVLFIATSMLLLAAACASFEGEGGDSQASSDAGVADDAATDANALDAAVVDAGNAPDVAVVPDGAVYAEGFESGSSCSGWTNSGGSTLLPMPPAHSGTRSCQICGVYGQGMSKTISTTTRTGTINLLLWAQGSSTVDGGAMPFETVLYVRGPAEEELGTHASGHIAMPNTWKQWQNQELAPAGTDHVTVFVNLDAEGCVFVDDMSMTVD